MKLETHFVPSNLKPDSQAVHVSASPRHCAHGDWQGIQLTIESTGEDCAVYPD